MVPKGTSLQLLLAFQNAETVDSPFSFLCVCVGGEGGGAVKIYFYILCFTTSRKMIPIQSSLHTKSKRKNKTILFRENLLGSIYRPVPVHSALGKDAIVCTTEASGRSAGIVHMAYAAMIQVIKVLKDVLFGWPPGNRLGNSGENETQAPGWPFLSCRS